MAKAATLDEPVGMEKADIKRHLRFAREDAISVAFAVGADGKAIVQFDKRKPGRALERKLKEDAPDSKSHRFGTAVVDPNDAKMVRFTVNKAGGGLARKLIVALKGTGFNKVKVCLDDGTELESHEEADEDAGDDEDGKPAAAGAAAGKAAGKAAGAADEVGAAAGDAAGEAAGEAAAPEQAAGQFDGAALAKDLTGLVKRMLAVIAKDSTQKAALTELATDAQVSLKRGDLEQASAGIDIFREAIQDGEAAIGGGGAKGAAPNGAAPNGAAPNGAAPNGAGPAANGAPAGNVKDHQAKPANGAAKPANGDATPDLRKEAEQILATLTETVKKALPFMSLVPGLGELVRAVVPAVQAAVKAGQIEQARRSLDQIVGEVLKAASAKPANGAGAGAAAANGVHAAQKQHHEHTAKHAPAIDKASNVWGATRQRVTGEVQKLEKAFTSALDGHGMADTLIKNLRTKVEDTLQHLDDRLMHALAAVNQASNAEERAKHVEHAHKLVDHYQKHVSADKTIQMLDSNPFLPLGIAKTVMASLAAVQKTIR